MLTQLDSPTTTRDPNGMTAESPPSVRPMQLLLPLLAITPEQFESFCRDLVKELPGIVECHKHGVQGDAQQGVDLLQPTRGRRFRISAGVCRRSVPATSGTS
jgi:hypothetical protein